MKLIISASVVVVILYYYYNYVDPGKPPTVDVNLIDHKLINIDPVIIHNASKSIPIENKKSILEFVTNELLHTNPMLIGGCSIFIAVFLIYWVPTMFLNSLDSKPKESNITGLNNSSEVSKLSEPEIAEKIARLAYLEKSIYTITAKQCREASNASTYLFFGLIIPNSDFEFFINKVDFSLLTSKNIFEYYKRLPINKRDSFLNAYRTYNMFNSNYNVRGVYSSSRTFLNNSDNIVNLYNSPELYNATTSKIIWNIAKLIYLEKSMYFSTSKLHKEASNISTNLLFERRLPNSDFEFFINKIDFKLLASKKVLDYYRGLHKHERDSFLYVYNNYKNVHSARNAPNSYNVLLNKLYNKSHMKRIINPFVKFFGKIFKKLTAKGSIKPAETDFVNLESTPLTFTPHEIDIYLKIERLADLERSMFIWTREALTDASNISTFLVRQLRLPNSNFEHFINYVDFSLLTDKDIFEFYKIVPTDKLDMFIYAYEKYKRS